MILIVSEKYLYREILQRDFPGQKAISMHTVNESSPFVHMGPDSAAISYSKYWWREGKSKDCEYNWKEEIMWDTGQNFLPA